MAARKRIAAALITLALSATGAVALLQGPQVAKQDLNTRIGARYEGPAITIQDPEQTGQSVVDWAERFMIPT